MGVRYGIYSSKVDKHKLSINMLVGNLERSFTFFFQKEKKKLLLSKIERKGLIRYQAYLSFSHMIQSKPCYNHMDVLENKIYFFWALTLKDKIMGRSLCKIFKMNYSCRLELRVTKIFLFHWRLKFTKKNKYLKIFWRYFYLMNIDILNISS